MNGVCREPMMSPYSSFSMTITAMWAGGPPGSAATGEGVVWTVPWRTALVPQPPSARIEPGPDSNSDRDRERAPGRHDAARSAIPEPLATAIARPSASATSARATAVRRPPCTSVAWAVASRPSLASGRR